MTRVNKKIINILIATSILFLALIGYLTYFEVFISSKYIASSYNKRQRLAEEVVLRGTIYDRNGVVLAESEKNDKGQLRLYPFGKLYSQVIGYNSVVYGKSLLELSYNKYLLGLDEYSKLLDAFTKSSGNMREGGSLHTTIDHSIQKLADKLMGKRNGAIAAIVPETGEVIALVSKPDFSPDEASLSNRWDEMIESENKPFLPRATQGLYAPGSTYKAAIAALAIENGLGGLEFDDNGSVMIDGRYFSNHNKKAYGKIDISEAMAVSSNVVFSQLGVMLGENFLRDMAERLGMNNDIPFDMPVSRSRFPYDRMEQTDMAAVGIGQGKLMISPLHMAMVASAIANDGMMMKPVLVNRITAANGHNIKTNKSSQLRNIMDKDTATKINQMMQKAVDDGTGKGASIKGIRVAGKTGTAENELTEVQKNKEHAWFIGFAPADDPAIAVAVLLEYSGGTGGDAAAPIAGKIMAEYLKAR